MKSGVTVPRLRASRAFFSRRKRETGRVNIDCRIPPLILIGEGALMPLMMVRIMGEKPMTAHLEAGRAGQPKP